MGRPPRSTATLPELATVALHRGAFEVVMRLSAQGWHALVVVGEERLSADDILDGDPELQRSQEVSLSEASSWFAFSKTSSSEPPTCSIPIATSLRPTVCREVKLSGTS